MNIMGTTKNKKPPFLYAKFVRSSEQPKMVSWLIKEGWVKSDREALWILLLTVFISISGSFMAYCYQNPPRFSSGNFIDQNQRFYQAYTKNINGYNVGYPTEYNKPINNESKPLVPQQ